ncbi:helix-turn-helix domain-containing protein [Sphingobium chungbukense]|uniref:helix-turn-helix domain-containing protein n=1 Tax=Sphingobium chungbukense TaxID=56193 RepID=UPI0006994B76|nr:helix-turn-helix transcriptional regulator [Sphingobium chungbukense]
MQETSTTAIYTLRATEGYFCLPQIHDTLARIERGVLRLGSMQLKDGLYSEGSDMERGHSARSALQDAQEIILADFALPDVSGEALREIANFVGAETTIVFGIDLDRKAVDAIDCKHHRKFWRFSEYRDVYFNMDPLMKQLSSGMGDYNIAPGSATVMSMSDRVPELSLINSEYYTDFLSKVDVYHKLAVLIRSRHDRSRAYAFGFHRPRRFRAFDEADKLNLNYLLPALSTSVEHCVLKKLSDERASLLSSLEGDRLTAPTIILDEVGKILFANMSARTLLKIDHNTHSLEDFKRICSTFSEHNGNTGKPFAESIYIDGTMLSVSVEKCSNDTFRNQYILKIDSGPQRNTTFFGDQFGLTKRESLIAHEIAAGHMNKIIANNLGISRRTVENHLRSIYQKTGVNSRTELVARVYGLENN